MAENKPPVSAFGTNSSLSEKNFSDLSIHPASNSEASTNSTSLSHEKRNFYHQKTTSTIPPFSRFSPIQGQNTLKKSSPGSFHLNIGKKTSITSTPSYTDFYKPENAKVGGGEIIPKGRLKELTKNSELLQRAAELGLTLSLSDEGNLNLGLDGEMKEYVEGEAEVLMEKKRRDGLIERFKELKAASAFVLSESFDAAVIDDLQANLDTLEWLTKNPSQETWEDADSLDVLEETIKRLEGLVTDQKIEISARKKLALETRKTTTALEAVKIFSQILARFVVAQNEIKAIITIDQSTQAELTKKEENLGKIRDEFEKSPTPELVTVFTQKVEEYELCARKIAEDHQLATAEKNNRRERGVIMPVNTRFNEQEKKLELLDLDNNAWRPMNDKEYRAFTPIKNALDLYSTYVDKSEFIPDFETLRNLKDDIIDALESYDIELAQTKTGELMSALTEAEKHSRKVVAENIKRLETTRKPTTTSTNFAFVARKGDGRILIITPKNEKSNKRGEWSELSGEYKEFFERAESAVQHFETSKAGDIILRNAPNENPEISKTALRAIIDGKNHIIDLVNQYRFKEAATTANDYISNFTELLNIKDPVTPAAGPTPSATASPLITSPVIAPAPIPTLVPIITPAPSPLTTSVLGAAPATPEKAPLKNIMRFPYERITWDHKKNSKDGTILSTDWIHTDKNGKRTIIMTERSDADIKPWSELKDAFGKSYKKCDDLFSNRKNKENYQDVILLQNKVVEAIMDADDNLANGLLKELNIELKKVEEELALERTKKEEELNAKKTADTHLKSLEKHKLKHREHEETKNRLLRDITSPLEQRVLEDEFRILLSQEEILRDAIEKGETVSEEAISSYENSLTRIEMILEEIREGIAAMRGEIPGFEAVRLPDNQKERAELLERRKILRNEFDIRRKERRSLIRKGLAPLSVRPLILEGDEKGKWEALRDEKKIKKTEQENKLLKEHPEVLARHERMFKENQSAYLEFYAHKVWPTGSESDLNRLASKYILEKVADKNTIPKKKQVEQGDGSLRKARQVYRPTQSDSREAIIAQHQVNNISDEKLTSQELQEKELRRQEEARVVAKAAMLSQEIKLSPEFSTNLTTPQKGMTDGMVSELPNEVNPAAAPTSSPRQAAPEVTQQSSPEYKKNRASAVEQLIAKRNKLVEKLKKKLGGENWKMYATVFALAGAAGVASAQNTGPENGRSFKPTVAGEAVSYRDSFKTPEEQQLWKDLLSKN